MHTNIVPYSPRSQAVENLLFKDCNSILPVSLRRTFRNDSTVSYCTSATSACTYEYSYEYWASRPRGCLSRPLAGGLAGSRRLDDVLPNVDGYRRELVRVRQQVAGKPLLDYGAVSRVAASPDSPYLRLILGVFPGRLI